jgi:hypothetical protein
MILDVQGKLRSDKDLPRFVRVFTDLGKRAHSKSLLAIPALAAFCIMQAGTRPVAGQEAEVEEESLAAYCRPCEWSSDLDRGPIHSTKLRLCCYIDMCSISPRDHNRTQCHACSQRD